MLSASSWCTMRDFFPWDPNTTDIQGDPSVHKLRSKQVWSGMWLHAFEKDSFCSNLLGDIGMSYERQEGYCLTQ